MLLALGAWLSGRGTVLPRSYLKPLRYWSERLNGMTIDTSESVQSNKLTLLTLSLRE